MNSKILQKYNRYLLVYLLLLFSLSVCFLFIKHNTGNDSTMSEWFINYTGGFTKRGLIGQISIFFARALDIGLRDIIFYFQSIILGIYFFLIYLFFKNVFLDRILLLSIFTPIFLLYPVYEVEVLARKEIFIFIIYIIHILTLITKPHFSNFSRVISFSLSVLIWEPILFFIPMWIFLDIVISKKHYNKILFSELIYYLPGLLICMIFILDPLTEPEHSKMAQILKKEFGETCYMSCSLLLSKSTISQQFTSNFHAYSFENIIRYIWIILIGFAPLFLLIYFSKLKINKDRILNYTKYNLFIIFLILLSPVILLFLMGYDWGRWVNISYTFTLLTFLCLMKKNLIILDKNKLMKHRLNTLSLRNFSLIFIIYCFSWSPKTVITGDIGSFPLYRAIYKIYKIFLLS